MAKYTAQQVFGSCSFYLTWCGVLRMDLWFTCVCKLSDRNVFAAGIKNYIHVCFLPL